MLFSRASERHAYWAHANRQFRRPSTTIGNTLEALYAGGLERRLRTAARVAEVLTKELSAELAGEIGVVSLRRGTLVLCVPDAAQAFQLQRTLADRLVDVFAAGAVELGVCRVRFKVG